MQCGVAARIVASVRCSKRSPSFIHSSLTAHSHTSTPAHHLAPALSTPHDSPAEPTRSFRLSPFDSAATADRCSPALIATLPRLPGRPRTERILQVQRLGSWVLKRRSSIASDSSYGADTVAELNASRAIFLCAIVARRSARTCATTFGLDILPNERGLKGTTTIHTRTLGQSSRDGLSATAPTCWRTSTCPPPPSARIGSLQTAAMGKRSVADSNESGT